MCLLILVPGRAVIGTKRRGPLERPMVRGVKGIPAFRKRAALEIATTSKGGDV